MKCRVIVYASETMTNVFMSCVQNAKRNSNVVITSLRSAEVGLYVVTNGPCVRDAFCLSHTLLLTRFHAQHRSDAVTGYEWRSNAEVMSHNMPKHINYATLLLKTMSIVCKAEHAKRMSIRMSSSETTCRLLADSLSLRMS